MNETNNVLIAQKAEAAKAASDKQKLLASICSTLQLDGEPNDATIVEKTKKHYVSTTERIEQQ